MDRDGIMTATITRPAIALEELVKQDLDRICKSLDTEKNRFCACWDDPVEGGTAWDCDSMPSTWK